MPRPRISPEAKKQRQRQYQKQYQQRPEVKQRKQLWGVKEEEKKLAAIRALPIEEKIKRANTAFNTGKTNTQVALHSGLSLQEVRNLREKE